MADEDERWLYGDSNPDEEEPGKDETTSEQPSLDTLKATVKNLDLKPPEIRNEDDKMDEDKITNEEESNKDGSKENDKENGTLKEESESMDATDDSGKKENGEIEDDEKGEENDEEEDDEDDEDDSDEDNVNVIIGDINKSGPTYTNINIPKRGPNITGPGVKSAGKFSIEDFESVGVINGVPAHEFNVDVIEDKPWRIPGADITDYFNYGFNEDTWKAYCERQKRIRIHESCTGLPTQTLAGQSWTNTQTSQNTQYGNTQPTGVKKTGWETGQIRVIGAGVASRRVDESGPESQNISVLPPSNNFAGIPPPNMMPPLIPPMEMPPPGFPPGADPYGPPPSTNEYFNPEPDYFSSYEPTAADQWRDGWTPGNLVTFGQNVNPNVLSHLEESNSQDRLLKEREKSRDRDRDSDRDRSRDRERSRDRDRERERTLEREDKDKRKERSHRNRSRSKSHERKSRKSRSRSPSHKKHKKKSKKSDRKKRSDDNE